MEEQLNCWNVTFLMCGERWDGGHVVDLICVTGLCGVFHGAAVVVVPCTTVQALKPTAVQGCYRVLYLLSLVCNGAAACPASLELHQRSLLGPGTAVHSSFCLQPQDVKYLWLPSM